jgi:hypothetical protein
LPDAGQLFNASTIDIAKLKLTSIPAAIKGNAMYITKGIGKAGLGPVIACLFAAALVVCLLMGVWNLR